MQKHCLVLNGKELPAAMGERQKSHILDKRKALLAKNASNGATAAVAIRGGFDDSLTHVDDDFWAGLQRQCAMP
jgi:hypothetical protein